MGQDHLNSLGIEDKYRPLMAAGLWCIHGSKIIFT